MRTATLILLISFASLSIIISCGGGPDFADEQANLDPPAALLVEKVIEGPLFGVSLRSPWGIAVAADNSIYCVDRGNDRLIKFRNDLTPIGDEGGTGAAAGLLDRPGYITVDNELNVWVSDEGNQRINRFNSDLLFVDAVEFYDADDPLEFGTPSGLGVNQYGELWVADQEKNRIVAYTAAGAFDRFIADFGYQGGQLSGPEDITVSRRGHFFVADPGNRRIVTYDQYGNHIRTIRNEAMGLPVASAPDGSMIWILDSRDGVLYYCDRNGDILFSAGPVLAGDSRPLSKPSDVALLSDERLLISDTGSNRLVLCKIIRGSE